VEYAILILAHLLGAAIWTGGHLILAIAVLPQALRKRDVTIVARFEERYERIGMPALLIQILTGLRLAYLFVPDFSDWFSLHDHVSTHITLKFVLLGLTLLLAIHARTRLIPRLSVDNLTVLAIHIVAITVVAVLFVAVGVSIRVGGLF
jgi:putative copper export protein